MHRIRSWARTKAISARNNPFAADASRNHRPEQPPGSGASRPSQSRHSRSAAEEPGPAQQETVAEGRKTAMKSVDVEKTVPSNGSASPTDVEEVKTRPTYESLPIWHRFGITCWQIIFSSWVNLLLIFVPVGIAVEYAHASPGIVFAMNAIAIVPLAGLLSYATESVALKLGDTVGALMNVTFGNAVELIIFIIALVKNEFQIVQASILGSMLSNLLLILGMCFLFGGLRFREQIYNSTVTQMSACLLSLSVISLLLPTAFHASFSDCIDANESVLKVSRGVSVVLLLVYILYLVFQLKSHAYMYESTPQNIIDEESHPGVLADLLNSSSSSDDSSSSDSDSSSSSGSSNRTAKRLRRVIRRGRKRKSSSSSKEKPVIAGSPPLSGPGGTSVEGASSESPQTARSVIDDELGDIVSGEEADHENEKNDKAGHLSRSKASFSSHNGDASKKEKKRKHRKSRKDRHERVQSNEGLSPQFMPIRSSPGPIAESSNAQELVDPNGTKVTDFASTKRPFNIRAISSALRPAIPRAFTGAATNQPATPTTPRAPGVLRRTSSLPDRLHRVQQVQSAPNPGAATVYPFLRQLNISTDSLASDDSGAAKHISRTSAILLLLVSTGLVALCAEYLVGSIDDLVETSHLSRGFVGLILLPIVGNAAEHVTAVTVAAKNKMDLAIGVAVGSSIQIALFVTPFIVILAWILDRAMSLYFNIFDTVALFVSAFIVNFLVLDGRSNYLEGALLMAAYIIIAVAAFFYPADAQQSSLGSAGGCPSSVGG